MLLPDNILLATILNLNDESQLRAVIQVISIILCVLFLYNNLNANTEKGKKRNYYQSNTGVMESMESSDSYTLDQNSPNPFFDSTTIRYSLPAKRKVNLEIYNEKAETVGILVDEVQEAGDHLVAFYAELEGVKLPAGIYYYRLKITDPANNKKNEFVDVKRMVIIE